MKKILIAICLLISVRSFSQLEGVTVSLQLRTGDWCFIVGSHIGSSTDSASIVYLNRLRDTIQLANPATFNTNVRFNSLPASIAYRIYVMVKSLPAFVYDQVGNNISNQIKAIVSTPLQTAITEFDNTGIPYYIDPRRRGKNFLSDN